MTGIIIVSVLLLILVILIVLLFKRIVNASSDNFKALKELDEDLKKRLEFVEVLKGIIRSYTNEEQIGISDVENIQYKLEEKMSIPERQRTEDKFSELFKYIFDSTERYPDLKESHTFEMLRVELTIVEQEIEKTRRAYNDTTRRFNALIKKFPNNLLAHILGYKKREFFEVDLITKEQVVIDFADRRKTERR